MMRALLTLVQIAFLGLLVGLSLSQTGQFDITLGAYRLQGESAILLMVLLTTLLFLLILHRVWIWIVHFPRTWRRYRRDIGLIKGHQALTRSLQALAAGDTQLAYLQATRAQKMMPDFQTVPTILLATTAEQYGHHHIAQTALQSLMSTEARDLGVRGLVGAAIKDNDWPRALTLARRAALEAPKLVSVARLAYDLECQCGEYASALARLPFLLKKHGITKDQARHDQVKLLTILARNHNAQDRPKLALRDAKLAHRLDPSFVPAACLLIDIYRGVGKTRRALSVLATCFALAPHPDLIEHHEQMAPMIKDLGKRLKYHEKFLALAPHNADAQLLMAKITENQGLWHQSLAYLQMAEKLDPRQGVYRALAHYADQQGDQKQVQHYLEIGMNARPDPVWLCPRTGRTLPQWEPLILPEHYFGSVIWGVPGDQTAITSPSSTLLGRTHGVGQ